MILLMHGANMKILTVFTGETSQHIDPKKSHFAIQHTVRLACGPSALFLSTTPEIYPLAAVA